MFPARGRPVSFIAFVGLLVFLSLLPARAEKASRRRAGLVSAAAPAGTAPSVAPAAITPSAIAAPAIPSGGITLADYPLDPGDIWRYRTGTFEPDSSGRLVTQIRTTEVRVLSKYHQGPLSVAALSRTQSGIPDAEEFFYLVADSSRLYSFSNPERLRMAITGAEALDPADAELDFPLLPGKRWGHAAMLERSDGLYVNAVGPAANTIVPAGHYPALPIEFRTLPDQMTTWISPGVGVVRYEYLHHGSTSRELRELVEFRHAAVDTAAVGRAIEHAFDALLETGGGRVLRTAIGGDPALGALLGPLTAGQSFDLDDGERRAFFHARGSTIVLQQIPDGPDWAYILRWKTRAGLVRAFLSPSPDAAASPDPDLSRESGGSRSPGPPAPLEKQLVQGRERLEKAERLLENGFAGEAGLLADAAIAGVSEALTDIPARKLAGLSPEGLKDLIRNEAGDDFLTTRYGHRLRIEDGRMRVNIESVSSFLGVEILFDDDSGTPVGAAPRLIRLGPAGAEIFVLRTGDPTAAIRRILALDSLPDPSSAQVIVWNGAAAQPSSAPDGAAPAPTPSVEVFGLDRSGVHRTWTKTLPSGTARLSGPPPRLELEYQVPDHEQPALTSNWREIYVPGERSGVPTLLSRELTNPWIRTVAGVVTALRAHDPAALGRIVFDPQLRDKLAGTWLADEKIALAGARSQHPVPAAIESNRVVSVSLVRSRTAPPAAAEPEVLTLKLAPAPDESWTVVDVTSGPADAWDQ